MSLKSFHVYLKTKLTQFIFASRAKGLFEKEEID